MWQHLFYLSLDIQCLFSVKETDKNMRMTLGQTVSVSVAILLNIAGK